MSEQITYENLIQRISTWANGATDVRMVMIVGSRARIDQPHDEWSDLDVVVVTDDPEKHIRQTDWLNYFFRPLLTFLEPTAVGGYVERRVLFEGGLDVDFSIVPSGIYEMKWTPEVESVFQRGVKAEQGHYTRGF